MKEERKGWPCSYIKCQKGRFVLASDGSCDVVNGKTYHPSCRREMRQEEEGEKAPAELGSAGAYFLFKKIDFSSYF